MAHQWRGVLREYADRLDISDATPIITLGEGGTPLIPADALSHRTGAKVWLSIASISSSSNGRASPVVPKVPFSTCRPARPAICPNSCGYKARIRRPSNLAIDEKATCLISRFNPMPIASVATR